MFANKPPLQKFGALQALDFPPATPISEPTTIVMLHGYGADAYDLASLREELKAPTSARWVFAQGPKEVEIGPGYTGRAWFAIDLAAHERAAHEGVDLSYADRRPPGINEARDQVLSFLKALNVPLNQLILGGFSQGAMLAVDVAMTLPQPVKGVILLSGTLADQKGIQSRAPHLKGLKFFQSHGQRDQVLPFSMAQALYQELTNAGWDGAWCDFGGGHEIPRPVVRDLTNFLRTL